LLSYVKENKDINLDISIPIRDRLFCNKIWNSFKFIKSMLPTDFSPVNLSSIHEDLNDADKWVLKEFSLLCKEVSQNFDCYKFGFGAEQIQHFWINVFCDFYIEYSKSVDESNKKLMNANRQCLFFILLNFLKLLHPIMPFLTEELFQKLTNFEGKKETISLEEYP
jgi:valyl-tRNA synthetase